METDNIFGQTSGVTELGESIETFEAPKLNRQELTDHLARTTATLLESTGLLQIVSLQASEQGAYFLCRVKESDKKTYMDKVVFPLIHIPCSPNERIACGIDFLPKDGKTVYAYRIAFESDNIDELVKRIWETIDLAVPKQTVKEVVEAPIVGRAPQSGGLRTGRKGAHPIGQPGGRR